MKTKTWKLLIGIIFPFFSFISSAQQLQVSENNRFLVKEDGSPFFWLADTGWEMLHRLDRDDIEFYLNTRASQGFTVIQTVILSEINGVTVPNKEGHLPLINQDPTKLNEDYFSLVDFAVKTAAELGIYLALLPTWGSNVEDEPHPLFDNVALFDQKNAEKYGQRLGKRYQNDWNVIWVLGGDRPATDYLDIWNAMAKGLERGSGGKHLISYHPRGQQSSSEWFQNTDWLDFNMVQTGHLYPGFPVYDWIKKDYDLTPIKPILNGEPAYEDIGYFFNPVNGRYDDYNVRKNAYWSVFSGAFGHTYGNSNIWQMWDKEHKPIIWANTPWHKALEHPGGSQMQYLKNLMLSRPYLSRIPDQSLMLGKNPKNSTAFVSITRDGTSGNSDATYIMVYLPYFGLLNVDTSVIPNESLRVWWYNPRTGEVISQNEQSNTGKLSVGFWSGIIKEEQGGPDWVVVIDDASKNYPLPGKSIYD